MKIPMTTCLQEIKLSQVVGSSRMRMSGLPIHAIATDSRQTFSRRDSDSASYEHHTGSLNPPVYETMYNNIAYTTTAIYCIVLSLFLFVIIQFESCRHISRAVDRILSLKQFVFKHVIGQEGVMSLGGHINTIDTRLPYINTRTAKSVI